MLWARGTSTHVLAFGRRLQVRNDCRLQVACRSRRKYKPAGELTCLSVRVDLYVRSSECWPNSNRKDCSVQHTHLRACASQGRSETCSRAKSRGIVCIWTARGLIPKDLLLCHQAGRMLIAAAAAGYVQFTRSCYITERTRRARSPAVRDRAPACTCHRQSSPPCQGPAYTGMEDAGSEAGAASC